MKDPLFSARLDTLCVGVPLVAIVNESAPRIQVAL